MLLFIICVVWQRRRKQWQLQYQHQRRCIESVEMLLAYFPVHIITEMYTHRSYEFVCSHCVSAFKTKNVRISISNICHTWECYNVMFQRNSYTLNDSAVVGVLNLYFHWPSHFLPLSLSLLYRHFYCIRLMWSAINTDYCYFAPNTTMQKKSLHASNGACLPPDGKGKHKISLFDFFSSSFACVAFPFFRRDLN